MSILTFSLAAAFALCAPGPRHTCVVDGDSFWLAGEKIRIADINAPETRGAACASERALGEAATRRLIVLLNAGPISLTSGPRDRDRYAHGQPRRPQPWRSAGARGPCRTVAWPPVRLVCLSGVAGHRE